MRIIPTVLAYDKASFDKIYSRLVAVAKEIHIDVMDGKFVSTTSVHPRDWPDLSKHDNITFEAHLMVADPFLYAPIVIEKGVKRIIVHLETINDTELRGLVSYCRKKKVQLMLALKSSTHTDRALRLSKMARGIMLMGVVPGKNRSPFIYHTVERIERLRKANKKLFLQVDGGANINTVKLIAQAGANVYNSGSFVSLDDHPAMALKELMDASKEN